MELQNKSISLVEQPLNEGLRFSSLGIKDSQIVPGSICYRAIDQAIFFGLQTVESRKALHPSEDHISLNNFEPTEARLRGILNSFDEPKEYKEKLRMVYYWMVGGIFDSRLVFLEEKMKSLKPDYCPIQRLRRINLQFLG